MHYVIFVVSIAWCYELSGQFFCVITINCVRLFILLCIISLILNLYKICLPLKKKVGFKSSTIQYKNKILRISPRGWSREDHSAAVISSRLLVFSVCLVFCAADQLLRDSDTYSFNFSSSSSSL